MAVVLGFGNRARNGKDTAAQTIFHKHAKAHGGWYEIEVINFADALRAEVNEQMYSISNERDITCKEALAILCEQRGVEYDPEAEADYTYPFSKQRHLLQGWGQGARRADPDYWVNIWKQKVLQSDADVILCTDLRYPNELETIRLLGGHSIKVQRVGYLGLTSEQSAHTSETALDTSEFDYTISVNDGERELLQLKALETFEQIMSTRRTF
jgi:hypothetical protein